MRYTCYASRPSCSCQQIIMGQPVLVTEVPGQCKSVSLLLVCFSGTRKFGGPEFVWPLIQQRKMMQSAPGSGPYFQRSRAIGRSFTQRQGGIRGLCGGLCILENALWMTWISAIACNFRIMLAAEWTCNFWTVNGEIWRLCSWGCPWCCGSVGGLSQKCDCSPWVVCGAKT